jgi:hypothetical protein
MSIIFSFVKNNTMLEYDKNKKFYNHTDMNTNTGTNNSELVQQLQQQLIQAQQRQLNSGNNGGYRNNMSGTSSGNLQRRRSFRGICYAMRARSNSKRRLLLLFVQKLAGPYHTWATVDRPKKNPK